MKKKARSETTLCTTFTDISILLKQQFDYFYEIIDNFSQELTSLVNLAENNRTFKQDNIRVINNNKSSLAKVTNLESDINRSFLHVESIAKDMDLQMTKVSKNIRISLDEAKYIHLSTNEYLSIEIERFIGILTNTTHESKIKSGQFS